MDNIERLVEYGLTRQEATLYLALAGEGELTGYEAAKITGISRSNAYNALACLVDKGAAYVMEGSVSKYVAVPFSQFCDSKLRYLQELREELIAEAPKIKKEQDGYITIDGDRQIRDKLIELLSGARERVYLTLPQEGVEQIRDMIAELYRRGVRIVLITEPGVKISGIRIYYARKFEHQISVIVDDAYVLHGEAGIEGARCLFSGNRALVEVFKDALRSKLKLID